MVAVITALPSTPAVTIPVFSSTLATLVFDEDQCIVPVGVTVLVEMLLFDDVLPGSRFKVVLVKVIVPVRSLHVLHSMQNVADGKYPLVPEPGEAGFIVE